MRFSFVVPVYNTERYLPRCLDSLFAQTEPDFEVIVVDDCSPGDCAGIVARYGDRVRYLRHDRNRSAFQARVTAVRAAKGDFIVPVDPDDYLMPELLARAREVIGVSDPDVISYLIDWDDGKRIRPHWCRHAPGLLPAAEAVRELIGGKFMNGVASKILRRTVLLEALEGLHAGDDLYVNTCDDYLMLFGTLLCSRTMFFLDYVGYRYFVNGDSTSHSWQTSDGLERASSQMRRVVDVAADFLTARTLAEPVRRDARTALDELERWFVSESVKCPVARLQERTEILLRNLHPENVAIGLLRQLMELKSSRSFKVVRILTKGLRNLVE